MQHPAVWSRGKSAPHLARRIHVEVPEEAQCEPVDSSVNEAQCEPVTKTHAVWGEMVARMMAPTGRYDGHGDDGDDD